jgi:hypothetical protein
MQDDPDLIEMIGAPADNPDERRAGPSVLELVLIDEIVGLDNLEVTTPQVGSPGDVSSQSEIVRTSGRESATNPFGN